MRFLQAPRLFVLQNLTMDLTGMTHFDRQNRHHLTFYVADDTDMVTATYKQRRKKWNFFHW